MEAGTIVKFLNCCQPCEVVFKGVFAADKIPDMCLYEKAACVINTDVSTGRGEHWLLFYYEDGKLEFFDSFGRSPEDFNDYISNYVKRFTYETNPIKLQSDESEVCGHYCICYCLLRCLGHSKENILQILLNIEGDRDEYVYQSYKICKEILKKLQSIQNDKMKKCCTGLFFNRIVPIINTLRSLPNNSESNVSIDGNSMPWCYTVTCYERLELSAAAISLDV
ncbi:uncharacterized protein NPIL_3791 [Nephila pilipes]|uniref:Uncharacterized protein n=1 Tax=Nephila pilipes TaxID=299642 RepID=A0A8X6MQV7_NEPPI|nr:uncharacterized protein NPIL_3791 [Nephila pilipes]